MTDTPEPTDDEQYARPFADVLRGVDRGRALDDAADRLHKVVNAVRETGKAGTVTITVEVKPLTKDSTDQLRVTAAATAKIPVLAPKPSVFFVDTTGNLTRNDPLQPTLGGPLRIPGEKAVNE